MPILPVLERTPDLPEERGGSKPKRNFDRDSLFAFDTETTWCGKKELRSAQFAYWDGDDLIVEVLAVDGFFAETVDDVQARLDDLAGCRVNLTLSLFATVKALRLAVQHLYEDLTYDGQPRMRRNKKGRMVSTGRRVKRCPAAFNANFDLGVIADVTELIPNMTLGIMEGSGVVYHFQSAYRREPDFEFGMKIKALYLGAFSVPYTSKRGEVWDISPAARTLWGAASLAGVGRHVGAPKLTGEGTDTLAYASMDAIVTLRGALTLIHDLERMGFTGPADRFISGATVAKDLMKQHYTPFYLSQEAHDFVWPAYFGGMTGALSPTIMREPLHDLIYGDLDGAYNASGQKLDVFKWDGFRWLTGDEVRDIIAIVERDPARYWEFGSLHLEVEGDFDLVPVRVGRCAEGSTPSKSEGLVWAQVREYRTVMALGDYLHSRPNGRVDVKRGLMATSGGSSPCLFKMCADERARFPKKASDGSWIRENFVPNTWWKLAANCLYGSLANRNGKERVQPGQWFNGLMASSITAAIRHAMWTVNHASDAFYNDTDSALTDVQGFHRAVEALKPLGIGFSNKTSDELGDADVAVVGVVQGSKRYALLGPDGQFGAKSHGLGSWFVLIDGRVHPVAHNEGVLRAVWSIVYPDVFGEPDPDLVDLPVFHRFSIRTQKVSDMVKEYARRQFDLPVSALGPYGKAGNFGFLSPSVEGSKIVPVVSYDRHDAARLSDLTLLHVASLWGQAFDKKFDYTTGERHVFHGSQFTEVRAVDRTQDIESGSLLGDNDISVHTSHGGRFD